MTLAANPFLGAGLALPIHPSPSGDLAMTMGEDGVAQSVWIILSTARGERRMRPDFGCGIHDLMFENNTPSTAGRLSREVREALLRFEPRVDVVDVNIRPGADQATLLIDVAYRIVATNTAANLVYPFYLNTAGGQ